MRTLEKRVGTLEKENAELKQQLEFQIEREVRKPKPSETLEERVSTLEKKKLPEWVEKMKWKGDLRLRNQTDWRDTASGAKPRHRQRIRYRLGMETELNEKLKVGARLASGDSGTGSSRSTNQTLDQAFSTKAVNLDWAYATYAPYEALSLTGGKFNNPYYQPRDLLWDTDLSFEGVAAQWTHPLAAGALPEAELFLTAGGYILDEISGSSQDPWLFATQGGAEIKLTKNVKWKVAGAWYDFANLKRAPALDDTESTNSFTGGTYDFAFRPIAVDSNLDVKKIADCPLIGPVGAGLYGTYVVNPDPSNDNQGFLAGGYLGDKKVKKKKQWQFSYDFRRLERDAFPDSFPDADFNEGETSVRGHEVIFQYGLLDNITLELDYYDAKRLTGSKQDFKLFQTDIVLKF